MLPAGLQIAGIPLLVDFASFNTSKFSVLSVSLFSALPGASAARGLQAAAAALRSATPEVSDGGQLEVTARIAERRGKNFARLTSRLERVEATVTEARETLLELKTILADMRKQIVLAQDAGIDDTQRRQHADLFDQALGKLNIKVRSAGGIDGNIIGSDIRDIFTPSTLTYKTRPDSPVDQTVSGIFSGADYVVTDGGGTTFLPDLFGAILKEFPDVEGDDGNLLSDSDTVAFDPNTGSLSLTRSGAGTPFLSGTLERKGLGVLHSYFYGGFTDSAQLGDALADLDAASAKLRFNITVVEGELTKVKAHREFNAKLVEEHRELAQQVEQDAIVEESKVALEQQRQQILFANVFRSTLTFDGSGSLLSRGIQSLFDLEV